MKKIFTILSLLLFLISCSSDNTEKDDNQSNEENTVFNSNRPSLLDDYEVTYYKEYSPNLENYTVADNFSNVINAYLIEEELNDEAKQKLLENNFVVLEESKAGNYEYYETYKSNSYYATKIPSFVTVDSLTHAFHLYYEYLQKQTEKNYLIGKISTMSSNLLSESIEQLEMLKGTKWENAAQRNVDYFSVAVALCGNEDYLSNDNVETELKNIYAADYFYLSPIFTTSEREYIQDYSQFTVRGYYTDTESLQRYFRVMQWYGQMTFLQCVDDLNKSALLINLAIKNNALKDYECIYKVTSFLAGESDDNTYYEYSPIVESCYGQDINVKTIVDKKDEYSKYVENIKLLPKPKINSMYTDTGSENLEDETCGFRLLGQRVSIDGVIIDDLTYGDVEQASDGSRRNLPNSLDVPAALGSDLALDIILETTDAGIYPNYEKQMESVRTLMKQEGDNKYKKSISSAWLGSIETLLEEVDEGWPSFMQSTQWGKKNLISYLGTYTELKHDLVLYQKQPMSGKGGGDFEVYHDDRGYVEPQPNVYHRLSSLLEAIVDGLNNYNLISQNDIDSLNELKEACDVFETISIKELNGELPTDEEFDFIRNYGDVLYNAWETYANDKAGGDEIVAVEDYPNYLVTDIATDSDNDLCLELGEGKPMTIYVAVYFDGEIRIARGATYSFYEFTMPISNRLTDSQWKDVIETGDRSIIPPLPSWYEDTYVKNQNMKGTTYLGSEYLLKSDTTCMITVLTDQLRIRNFPSTKYGEVVGQVKQNGNYELVGDVVQNEGYTWYYIGYDQWIADDGTWLDVKNSPKDINEDTCNIKILDSDMGIYSYPNRNGATGNSVYQGEEYFALNTYQDENNGIVWYNIGYDMWIKDSMQNERVELIN